MADIEIVSVGTMGPTGPGAVAPGTIITARGDLIIGNSSAVPARLPIGTTGKYLRTDGTDPSWAAIVAADLPTAIDAAKIGGGAVSNTEFSYLDGVTSAIQTQLGGKAATSHTHLVQAERGIYVDSDATSTATTDNTSSTSTWATAMDTTITLPTGSWLITAVGGIALKHSASGIAEGRVTVDGQDSTQRLTGALSSTLWIPVMDDDSKSGCTGAVHIRVQFRSNDAGTTYARNPWFFLVAERSA